MVATFKTDRGWSTVLRNFGVTLIGYSTYPVVGIRLEFEIEIGNLMILVTPINEPCVHWIEGVEGKPKQVDIFFREIKKNDLTIGDFTKAAFTLVAL